MTETEIYNIEQREDVCGSTVLYETECLHTYIHTHIHIHGHINV